MPAMNGIEMIMELTRTFLDVKVIAMSGGVESEGVLRVANLLGARQTDRPPLTGSDLYIRSGLLYATLRAPQR